jgi:hypothetical protein
MYSIETCYGYYKAETFKRFRDFPIRFLEVESFNFFSILHLVFGFRLTLILSVY